MDKEERIRQRAYALWEQEGRPEGRQEEHWQRARDEIEAEGMGQEGFGSAAIAAEAGTSGGTMSAPAATPAEGLASSPAPVEPATPNAAAPARPGGKAPRRNTRTK